MESFEQLQQTSLRINQIREDFNASMNVQSQILSSTNLADHFLRVQAIAEQHIREDESISSSTSWPSSERSNRSNNIPLQVAENLMSVSRFDLLFPEIFQEFTRQRLCKSAAVKNKLSSFKAEASEYSNLYPHRSESFMLYHAKTNFEDAMRLEIQTPVRVVNMLPEFSGVINTDSFYTLQPGFEKF